MEKKQSVFTRFINFIKSILKKDMHKQIPEITTKASNNESKTEFINDIKLQNDVDFEILKLQEKYEYGELKLSLLSDEQLHSLNLLYTKQISDLEKKLKSKQIELNVANIE